MTTRSYPDRLLDGRHLRAAREAAGLRQEQLAAAAGLHANSLRYWERHTTEPYGVAVDKLLHTLQERGVRVAVDLDARGYTAIIERRQTPKTAIVGQ
jgi:DNA-binding transcriptional regulator YiaG